ncbi:mitogen-activated protein kinase kinase kinase 18 [Dendrobium catenatum]|uniref:Mitogen-activated protein kinase kinase kinase 2 n=1 Tax=Dendrobium catenatum TaxID=906689 RepID=A0A2I0WWX0_9ASPA|nr:mitogen-activated protein kinase kinase kinase 18 [Dendrobium catenatum]PKU80143.1 Mitogen-activated protein kinase kinase kinase 2 [Dendrobium catenatum]
MATAAWLRGIPIGRGATATVSVAAASTGELFAVKSAPLSHSAPLQREQSILSSLNFPSILSCLGFEITKEAGGTSYFNLFLEYAAGGSLSDDIKRRGGRLNEADIRTRARDILSGLAHLHKAGVVHCDVKPGNVLIGSDGRAKIGDLGCARWIADGEREIRGSPMYMAPEAVRGQEQGTPADLWSFGCTVIEMATGRPPWPDVTDAFEGISRIGFSGEVPAIPDCFSDEAKDFVNNCLKTDPMERWTADELLRHPFVECSSSSSNCTDFNWISPKSTLDPSLWESTEEQEVADEEEFSNEPAAGRIQELASVSSTPNWTWDEDWVEVRKVAGECAAKKEVISAIDVAGGQMGVTDFLISDEAASTSGGEEIVFRVDIVSNESRVGCGWEEGHTELIRVSPKMGIVDNRKGYYWGFVIWFLASFLKLTLCVWPFYLVLFLL